jgi:Na+-transporting NADH:ubiquinone oxidoreductase subunit C
MKGSLYTVIYAAVLGTTCAFLLTAVAEVTRERAEANKKAEEYRNIFSALNVPFDAEASSEKLEEVYSQNIVEKEFVGEEKLYVYVSPESKDDVIATAVKLHGAGLWGPIKGVMALEPDMKTIRGITFYEQEETPGLGGEIATEPFLSQFKAKSIYDAEGKPGIVIKGGKSPNPINEVDGITGATMTCDKVQELINVSINKIAEAK